MDTQQATTSFSGRYLIAAYVVHTYCGHGIRVRDFLAMYHMGGEL